MVTIVDWVMEDLAQVLESRNANVSEKHLRDDSAGTQRPGTVLAGPGVEMSRSAAQFHARDQKRSGIAVGLAADSHRRPTDGEERDRRRWLSRPAPEWRRSVLSWERRRELRGRCKKISSTCLRTATVLRLLVRF